MALDIIGAFMYKKITYRKSRKYTVNKQVDKKIALCFFSKIKIIDPFSCRNLRKFNLRVECCD